MHLLTMDSDFGLLGGVELLEACAMQQAGQRPLEVIHLQHTRREGG